MHVDEYDGLVRRIESLNAPIAVTAEDLAAVRPIPICLGGEVIAFEPGGFTAAVNAMVERIRVAGTRGTLPMTVMVGMPDESGDQ